MSAEPPVEPDFVIDAQWASPRVVVRGEHRFTLLVNKVYVAAHIVPHGIQRVWSAAAISEAHQILAYVMVTLGYFAVQHLFVTIIVIVSPNGGVAHLLYGRPAFSVRPVGDGHLDAARVESRRLPHIVVGDGLQDIWNQSAVVFHIGDGVRPFRSVGIVTHACF